MRNVWFFTTTFVGMAHLHAARSKLILMEVAAGSLFDRPHLLLKLLRNNNEPHSRSPWCVCYWRSAGQDPGPPLPKLVFNDVDVLHSDGSLHPPLPLLLRCSLGEFAGRAPVCNSRVYI